MAIRKLRKKMKLPIAIFVVAFIATILYSIVGGINYWKASQRHALTLNGTKIDAVKIDRSFKQGLDYYENQYGADKINQDDLKLILFNNLIKQELLGQSVKKLKVKVSNSEVEALYKREEGGFRDKETFLNALRIQGYNKGTFREELKKSISISKAKEAIEATVKVEESEMKEYYEANKYEAAYNGKTYEESKTTIQERLLKLNKNNVYNSFIKSLREKAKIEWREDPRYEEYKKYAESYEEGKGYTVLGYKYSNVDLAKRKMMQRFYGLSDEEALDKSVKEEINREVKVASVAKEKGIVVDEKLAQQDQISELTQKLREKLINEVEITDKELKDYFDENEKKYDVKESADAKIIKLEIKPSEADDKASLEKANKILAKAIEAPENFAQLAMKYSDGPSAPKGGSLGWFKKGQMIAEFEKAAFKGEIGIYPNVVKTQFGYHIINIEDKKDNQVKASHILVASKPSDETVEAMKSRAEELITDIKSGDTKFEDVAKKYSKLKQSTITNITKGGYIQGIGSEEKLNDDIFAANLNELTMSVGDNNVYIIEKIKYVPFKAAKLDEMKDKVKYDLANQKANTEMIKISNETEDTKIDEIKETK